MVIQTRMTTQEFQTFLADHPDDTHDYELINGELVPMSPSSYRNSKIAITIAHLIRTYLDQTKRGGGVSGSDGGFEIMPDTVRVPDVAYISDETMVEPEAPFPSIAPDWVVEVISPSETHTMIRDKVHQYLEAGTKLVWVVFPESQTIDTWQVIENEFRIRTYAENQTISAAPVLPALEISVAEIFDIG